MKFCGECGSKLKDAQKFCTVCGNRVKDNAEAKDIQFQIESNDNNKAINNDEIKMIEEPTTIINSTQAMDITPVNTDFNSNTNTDTNINFSIKNEDTNKGTSENIIDDDEVIEFDGDVEILNVNETKAITLRNISTSLTHFVKFHDLKDVLTILAKKKGFQKLLIISVILLASIFGIQSYVEKLLSPTHIVTTFEKSIKRTNYKNFSKVVSINKSDDVIDENSFKSFADYLNSNKDVFNALIADLNKQAQYYSESNKAYYSDLKALDYATRNIGVFTTSEDKYRININTVDVHISIPSEKCKVFVNDEEVSPGSNDSTTNFYINNLLPAKYTITAKYSDDATNIEDSIELNLYEKSSATSIALLKDKLSSVLLYTNVDSAKLLVNGTEVKEFKSGDSFGPVTKGMKFQAVYTKNNKEYKSEVVNYIDSSTVKLNIDKSKLGEDEEDEDEDEGEALTKSDGEIKDEVVSLLRNYYKAHTDAVNKNDYNLISSYVLSGSPLESMQESNVASLYNQKLTESLVDFVVSEIKPSESKREVSLTVSETFKYTDESKKSKNETSNVKYKVTYNDEDGKYYLSDYNS